MLGFCGTSPMICKKYFFEFSVSEGNAMPSIKKMRLYVIFFLLLFFFSLGLCVAWKLWKNNHTVSFPEQQKIEASFILGVAWLEKNHDTILADENPMLWWMIKRSAELTQNSTLLQFYAEYKQRYLDSNPRNVWAYLFESRANAFVDPQQLEHLPGYNQLFIYGSSCDSLLAQDPAITAQLTQHFCDNQLFAPTCLTHQLTGLRIALQNQCGDTDKLRETISQLQERIVNQLTWDFRLVDVYVQRVWVLLESGVGGRVKPIWIQRVLMMQSTDGGWSGFEPVVPISSQQALGFSSKGVGVGRQESNFHTTAQGIYLMSLLLAGE
jgi:hypothetical protein